jgi:RNA polymerase sigma-70 factor (ECF subfamily)
MRQHRHLADQVEFDELRDSGGEAATVFGDPALAWERQARGRRVDAAIEALAPPFREVIVLRELEEMSYEDIARVAGIPIGTVMSRLSRARALLRTALQAEVPHEARQGRRDAST